MNRKQCMQTIDRYSYNCMGYALSTFKWEDFGEGCCRSTNRNWEGIYYDHKACVKYLLKHFNLVQVRSLKNIPRNQVVIAFATGFAIGDFHFVRRGKNGVWYHKMGNTPRIRRMTEEQVLAGHWCRNLYDKKVSLFIPL